jgi:hypothetical protein
MVYYLTFLGRNHLEPPTESTRILVFSQYTIDVLSGTAYAFPGPGGHYFGLETSLSA